MAEILPLSLDAPTLNGVVLYYSHELDKDISGKEAKDHLREDLYLEIEKIAEQGHELADPE